MKSLSIFFLVLVLAAFVTAVEKNELSTESKRTDVVGETFNIDGKPAMGAIAYGVASNGGYVLKDDSHYVKPEMVTKLPEKIPPPKGGPIEVVDEIPSVTDYYNGDAKLNKIQINCHIYANPTDCVHNSHCGWCGASKSCIVGNSVGPLESCVKSSYIFAAPTPSFNPHTRVINENVGGLSLTVVSK